MKEPRELLSPARTAEILTVLTKTLRALWEAGELPRVRIGAGVARGRFAYDPADVEAYIRRRKEYGPPPPVAPTHQKRRQRARQTTDGAIVDFDHLRRELRALKPRKDG